MRVSMSKDRLKQLIKEETQRVLIEREFAKYFEENIPKLLAEGKSQKEIEQLMAEGLKDTAKRIAMKYGLPLMAVMSILTSQVGMNKAYAATPAGPPGETPTMVTPAAAEEEDSGSFWDRLGDLVKKGKEKHGEKPYHFSRSMLNFPSPASQLDEPAEPAAAEKGPKTSKEWFNANRDLMRKHGATKIVIDGELMGGKFTPSKKMAKKYNIKGDIDLSSATTDAEKTHLIYKHVLEPGAK